MNLLRQAGDLAQIGSRVEPARRVAISDHPCALRNREAELTKLFELSRICIQHARGGFSLGPPLIDWVRRPR